MAELAITILELNATSGQAGKIQAFAGRATDITEGLLHQAVHTAAPFMFSVGEHNKALLQPGDSLHVARIELARQRILDQLHADPVQVLNDQQLGSVNKVVQELLRCEAGHRDWVRRARGDQVGSPRAVLREMS